MAVINGTSGDDTLNGTSGDDTINGLAGDDTISGGAGQDIIGGGAGADSIRGDDGDDFLFSDVASLDWSFPVSGPYTPPPLDRGTEVDTLVGGDGSDAIFAGYGDNVNGGSDGLHGDTLFISFQGAPEGVTFDASLATQVIGGGTITGIENISWVEGSNFDDYINVDNPNATGYGDTAIFGMGGNDTLIGGYKTTFMDGGDGNDIVDGRNSQYLREIHGGAGDDMLYTNPDGWAAAFGGDGNDTIYAHAEIHGGAGNDVIHVLNGREQGPITGGDGNDTIYGSNRNDRISGDAGNDTIAGGAGGDIIDGGDGNDILDGGTGSDILRSGAGDNVLTGGAGYDEFIVEDGNNVITDFTADDTLQIRAGFSADSITQVGSDVVVTLSNGNQLTFQNRDVATITAALPRSIVTNDVALSPDGSTIYATGQDGNLYVYSAETGEMLHSWRLGSALGGIDISPDGTFAMVVDLVPVASLEVPGSYPIYTMAVYRVDLTNGAVTTYTHQEVDGFSGYTFYDVAVLNDGTVLLSETLPPGWSGFPNAQLLNLETGDFTRVYDISMADAPVLTRSRDGSSVLVTAQNNSGAPIGIYEAGVGFMAIDDPPEGVYGFNDGVQAYSGEAGLVAQFVPISGLHIYDRNSGYLRDLTDQYPQFDSVAGMAFDATGQYLFVLTGGAIHQLSTADWSVVATYSVSASAYTTEGDFGNRLLIGPNMRYFTVVTDNGGFVVINNPNSSATINGTSGADSIVGTGLYDEIYGRGGDDHIVAGAGNDVVHGDAGNDTLDGGAGADRMYGARATTAITSMTLATE